MASCGPHSPWKWLSVHQLPHWALDTMTMCLFLVWPRSLGFQNLCTACSLAWKDIICAHHLISGSCNTQVDLNVHSLQRLPWTTQSKGTPNLSVYFLHCILCSWCYLVFQKYACILFFSGPWSISSTGKRTLPIWSNVASLALRTTLGHSIAVCWVTELKTQGTFPSSPVGHDVLHPSVHDSCLHQLCSEST